MRPRTYPITWRTACSPQTDSQPPSRSALNAPYAYTRDPVRRPACDPRDVRPDQLERRDASTPSRRASRAELLHVLMLPDFERADRIGEFWSYPESRTFAELLIDCEEDRTMSAPASLTQAPMCQYPAMRGRAAMVAVGIVTVLAGASCTSDTQPETEAAPPEATTASPSPTMLPRLPLSEARLDGKYDVKVFVTSNSFHSKPAPRQAFRFIPKCDEGACDVTLLGRDGLHAGIGRSTGGGGREAVRCPTGATRPPLRRDEGRLLGRSATLSRKGPLDVRDQA